MIISKGRANMTYSEAKKIIKKLHDAGWEKKYPGHPYYIKTWKLDWLQTTQSMSFNEVMYSLFSLEYILNRYDSIAETQLINTYKMWNPCGLH